MIYILLIHIVIYSFIIFPCPNSIWHPLKHQRLIFLPFILQIFLGATCMLDTKCWDVVTLPSVSAISYQSHLMTCLWNLMVSRSLKDFPSWDYSMVSECHSENVVHISVYSFGHFWPEQYFRLHFLCPVALTWWPGHIHVSP